MMSNISMPFHEWADLNDRIVKLEEQLRVAILSAKNEEADNMRLKSKLKELRSELMEWDHGPDCCEEESYEEDGSYVVLCDCGLQKFIDFISDALKDPNEMP